MNICGCFTTVFHQPMSCCALELNYRIHIFKQIDAYVHNSSFALFQVQQTAVTVLRTLKKARRDGKLMTLSVNSIRIGHLRNKILLFSITSFFFSTSCSFYVKVLHRYLGSILIFISRILYGTVI